MIATFAWFFAIIGLVFSDLFNLLPGGLGYAIAGLLIGVLILRDVHGVEYLIGVVAHRLAALNVERAFERAIYTIGALAILAALSALGVLAWAVAKVFV